MWALETSRSFEKAAKQLPKAVLAQMAAWLEPCASGFGHADELRNVVWLTNNRQFGRVRFGKYRLGLMVDEEGKRVVLMYVGARGDFYKRFPPR